MIFFGMFFRTVVILIDKSKIYLHITSDILQLIAFFKKEKRDMLIERIDLERMTTLN